MRDELLYDTSIICCLHWLVGASENQAIDAFDRVERGGAESG